jgi:TRAP-type mannitol/chloroaromatic compound transport system permease large subunit
MDYLAAWMFLALTILLMAGFPVTFTLLGTALTFGLIGFGWDFFNLLPLRIWGRMTNVTLSAVPLFVFMGVMLERSGLAEELLETMGLLFGRLRGGLAISVVVVGALLGASTGIVGATVVTMGLLAVPTMLRRGYQKELATGTVSASGTLGQIIPPSIVLVLIGDIVGVSVGELFIGAARNRTGHFKRRTGGNVFPPACLPRRPGAGSASVFNRCRTGFHICRHCLPDRGGCCRCGRGNRTDDSQPKI